MGRSVRQPLAAYVPERIRRPSIARPATRRADFRSREAQLHLQKKEMRWAPYAYGVFAAAAVIILFFAYATYAFSEYRGEILPGTHVDQLQLGGLTEKQASTTIVNQLAAVDRIPIQLTYNGQTWRPTAQTFGLKYFPDQTAKAATDVGRSGSLLAQLIDRLPLHPSHDVTLEYSFDEKKLSAYLGALNSPKGSLNKPPVDAQLKIDASTGFHVVLVPSVVGVRLNVADAETKIRNALGSLTVQTEALKLDQIQPTISDNAALSVRDRVENFLSHPPVIAVGRRVILMTRADLGPFLSFQNNTAKGHVSITLNVDPNKVAAYVSGLASEVDRPALDAKLNYSGGKVLVIQPQQTGRTLDQAAANKALLPVIQSLKLNARLHFSVATIPPPIDQSNPASLGISTLIGYGQSSFLGAGPTRLQDITALAKSLDQDLISPTQDISFNTLVGTGWLDRVYSDRPREIGGKLVPGGSGAMQQVATTFLRAMYDAGLKVEERHAHSYRLPWYELPVGLDAVVAPGRNWDLRFANTTGKYLLIETRVEPVKQQLSIYVYGPKLGWHVSVDNQGRVTKVFPHGPEIQRQDPSLAPGQQVQISWAIDGASTVVQRTITYKNGRVHSDEIDSTYQPSVAIVATGAAAPAASPTARARARGGTPVPPGTPGTSGPTPTATFNH